MRAGSEIMTYYISLRRNYDHQAGAKAPNDIYTLCERRGWAMLSYPCPQKRLSTRVFRLRRGILLFLFWFSALFRLKPGDLVFYQHPVRYGSKIACRYIRRLQKKQVRFLALVHDLDTLRYELVYTPGARTNAFFEDNTLLRQFDAVICHNERMKAFLLEKGFPEERLICLQLFDYLISSSAVQAGEPSSGIVIAGNLDQNKSGYLYQLAQLDLSFPVHLYGVNYTESGKAQNALVYHGSFAPEQLPQMLAGRFGLVWDGNSLDTCCGPGGNYLRYNNPHKLSLYLAAGIPVITWCDAAVASFVENNRIGITVASLRELPEVLSSVSDEDYSEMKERVKTIQERVIRGDYFNQAVEQALKLF